MKIGIKINKEVKKKKGNEHFKNHKGNQAIHRASNDDFLFPGKKIHEIVLFKNFQSLKMILLITNVEENLLKGQLPLTIQPFNIWLFYIG